MSDSPDSDMGKINPQQAKQLLENFTAVKNRIQAANTTGKNIRLIAVSKLHPAPSILALHNAPTLHLHFGENYLQELIQKSALLPRTIRWHFIGALQSNKCRPLAEGVPNLWCVESVDSVKKAGLLEKGRAALVEAEAEAEAQQGKDGSGGEEGKKEGEGEEREKLRVFVQVNTSAEPAKSGVEPGAAVTELCKYIRDECAHLRLQGLMTIGAIARSQATTAETENEDFKVLREIRDQVAGELGVGEEELELSMGMSADFEGAVRLGSDEVRVGSTIFGERPAKEDAKVKGDVEEGED